MECDLGNFGQGSYDAKKNYYTSKKKKKNLQSMQGFFFFFFQGALSSNLKRFEVLVSYDSIKGV